MISKEQQTLLKNLLGRSYATEVQEFLKKKKVFNSNGAEYSKSHIANVMNGRYENKHIENAIFEVFEVEKKKQTKLLEKRKRILETE